jgi:DNA-binding protein HU-beta
MNKTELVDAVAKKTEVTKKETAIVLNAIIAEVEAAVVKGEKVQLIGFGTFEQRKRAARKGKNPQNGKEIQIAAAKVPAFKAGQAFKDAVNGKKKTAVKKPAAKKDVATGKNK